MRRAASPAAPAPTRLRGHARDLPVTVARRAAAGLLRAWLRLDVQGAEHLPQRGGLLVAATHESHADALAVATALRGRRLLFLGAADLAETPVLGPLLPRWFGLLPVRRGAGDSTLLPMLADELEAGVALAVFPEGSRSRDGLVHRPRSGTARLAAMTGVPVLPVGLAHSAAVWPVDERPRLRPAPRPVRVRVGPPLDPPEDDALARRAWSDALHRRLAELSGRALGDAFAPTGGGA